MASASLSMYAEKFDIKQASKGISGNNSKIYDTLN
jgi:hypothetical protein